MKSYKNVFSEIQNNPYQFLFSILFDFLLLILFGIILSAAFFLTLPHLEVMVGEMTLAMTEQASPAFYEHYTATLSIFIGLGIITLIGFLFIKGSNCKLFLLKKKGYWKYMLKFLGVNILWILMLYILLSAYLNIAFATMMNPIISLNALTVIFYMLSWIIIYFASISYVKIEKGFKVGIKEAFIAGIKKAKLLLPNFIILMLLFYILKFIAQQFPKLSVAYLLFILLPLVAFNRKYIKENC